jgi:hypothetical protein
MTAGDRVFLSGGYDVDPSWLCGRRGYRGVIERIIPGQLGTTAAVVRLDEPIEVDGISGQYLVMQPRVIREKWAGPSVIALAELCDFAPEAVAWKKRRQGRWVESHATIELETQAISRGAV